MACTMVLSNRVSNCLVLGSDMSSQGWLGACHAKATSPVCNLLQHMVRHMYQLSLQACCGLHLPDTPWMLFAGCADMDDDDEYGAPAAKKRAGVLASAAGQEAVLYTEAGQFNPHKARASKKAAKKAARGQPKQAAQKSGCWCVFVSVVLLLGFAKGASRLQLNPSKQFCTPHTCRKEGRRQWLRL